MPWLVFLVSVVVARTALVRGLSVTCVAVAACLHRPKRGAVGIGASTLTSVVMHCALLWRQVLYQPWSCQKVLTHAFSYAYLFIVDFFLLFSVSLDEAIASGEVNVIVFWSDWQMRALLEPGKHLRKGKRDRPYLSIIGANVNQWVA